MPKHVLILSSHTGSGHISVSKAIKQSLVHKYGQNITLEILDVLRGYTPIPLKYFPEIYAAWVTHNKASWGIVYHLTDGKNTVNSIRRAS